MTNDLTAPQTAALRFLDGTARGVRFRSVDGEGISGSALAALIRKGLVETSGDWSDRYTGTSYALTAKGAQVLRSLHPTSAAPAAHEPATPPHAPAGHVAEVLARVSASKAPAPTQEPVKPSQDADEPLQFFEETITLIPRR